jgi:hypothetical protein
MSTRSTRSETNYSFVGTAVRDTHGLIPELIELITDYTGLTVQDINNAKEMTDFIPIGLRYGFEK